MPAMTPSPSLLAWPRSLFGAWKHGKLPNGGKHGANSARIEVLLANNDLIMAWKSVPKRYISISFAKLSVLTNPSLGHVIRPEKAR